jgi:hypothetical protein
MAKQGVYQPQTSTGQTAVGAFISLTVQYCGDGVVNAIDIQDGFGYSFDTVYLEGNNTPNDIYLSGDAASTSLRNVSHNLVAGYANKNVVCLAGNQKNTQIDGITSYGGNVNTLVLITGALPLTVAKNLYMASGVAANGLMQDLSTRKATVLLDGLSTLLGPTKVVTLSSVNAMEWRDNVTDAVNMFVRGSTLYFGADTTAPALSKSGGTMSMTYSAGVGSFRAPSLGLGATGGPIWISGSGSPETFFSAPVGSIYSRTNGGALTSFYVKESGGTGNTGWVAK